MIVRTHCESLSNGLKLPAVDQSTLKRQGEAVVLVQRAPVWHIVFAPVPPLGQRQRRGPPFPDEVEVRESDVDRLYQPMPLRTKFYVGEEICVRPSRTPLSWWSLSPRHLSSLQVMSVQMTFVLPSPFGPECSH